jgi:hypothetical protein
VVLRVRGRGEGRAEPERPGHADVPRRVGNYVALRGETTASVAVGRDDPEGGGAGAGEGGRGEPKRPGRAAVSRPVRDSVAQRG